MSKVFKKDYPYNRFVEFIDKISIKHKDYYFFDINLYKKARYNKIIDPFISSLGEYYKENKKHYILKTMDYKSFMTVIRQLCKRLNIRYENKMKYLHNSYHIEYYLYIHDTQPFQ